MNSVTFQTATQVKEAQHTSHAVVTQQVVNSVSQATSEPYEEIPTPQASWSELKEETSSDYDAEEYLQGMIHTTHEEATRREAAILLSIRIGEAWKVIAIDPTQNQVLSEICDEQLEKLCNMPIFCLSTKTARLTRRETQFEFYRNGNEQQETSIEQFLWKTALWTSAGRIPRGTVISNPLHLIHWPNLTRLKQIPNGIRIAALLADQPAPPALVSKVLDIPVQQVYSFYAAAKAIGLATSQEKHRGHTTFSREPSDNTHHTLFGRILKRLGAGE